MVYLLYIPKDALLKNRPALLNEIQVAKEHFKALVQ